MLDDTKITVVHNAIYFKRNECEPPSGTFLARISLPFE